MDFVLLIIVLFYFIKGCYRGFVEIIFSIIATAVGFFIAYKFCDELGAVLQNQIDFQNFIEKALNYLIGGEFSNIDDVYEVIAQKGGIFKFFLLKILSNVSFEGKLTFAQIFAPILNNIFLKIISFILIYVFIWVLLRFIKILLKSFLKHTKFWKGNRVLGGVLGLIKGVLVFLIIYVLIINLGNVCLNEQLLNFCQIGKVSNFIYNIFIKKGQLF